MNKNDIDDFQDMLRLYIIEVEGDTDFGKVIEKKEYCITFRHTEKITEDGEIQYEIVDSNGNYNWIRLQDLLFWMMTR